MEKELRIGIIGYNFMGRAHSNAWSQASKFFDPALKPVLKVACGRNREAAQAFADRWGWEEVESDWRKVVERDDIDAIDIALPQSLHHDVAMAAAANGKHIFCEKPLAISSEQAKAMLAAAEKAGVCHYLNHNYRRVPAIMLARQMIEEGKLGRIFHWRGAYQQDWIVDPDFPLTWQLQKESAWAGPHADLNSHSVDLARYLVGEIRTISCLTSRFVDERPLPDDGATAFSESASSDGGKRPMGKVTVEDAALMLAEFENGAVGTFEATRFASGRKNKNSFEIYGSEGSLTFDLERLNELQYFSRNDPEGSQGFRTILATESVHPFIAHWWPPGHTLGYEHSFTHAAVDFLRSVADGTPIHPNFEDGLRCIQVLEAGLQSAEEGRRIDVSR